MYFPCYPVFFNVIDKVALLYNCQASSLKFSVESSMDVRPERQVRT